MLPWLAMLGSVAAILGGGLWLRSRGRLRPAIGVLLILAFPATKIGLFFLALIVPQADWR
jgi:hypothetical protein